MFINYWCKGVKMTRKIILENDEIKALQTLARVDCPTIIGCDECALNHPTCSFCIRDYAKDLLQKNGIEWDEDIESEE